jgi:hypothetical protein
MRLGWMSRKMELDKLNLRALPAEKAQELYNQGMRVLERYRRTGALRLEDYNRNTATVDGVTHAVIGASGAELGVVAGDPLDYTMVRADLAYISAVRGMLGKVVADAQACFQQLTNARHKVRGELQIDYFKKIRAKLLDGKESEEGIMAYVIQDERYIVVQDQANRAEHAMNTFTLLRDGLLGLENALKKSLEMGKDQ